MRIKGVLLSINSLFRTYCRIEIPFLSHINKDATELDEKYHSKYKIKWYKHLKNGI